MIVKSFNIQEIREFIIKRPKNSVSLNKDDYRFFSWDDLSIMGGKEYLDTLRFSLVYDKSNIYGISKCAKFPYEDKYSISYVTVGNEFKGMGISKLLVEEICNLYSNNFTQWSLSTSHYTVSGWNYLRPTLLRYTKNFGIDFIDSYIDYPDDGKFDSLYFKLKKRSIKEYSQKYPECEIY
jgi:hypothetical protein